MNSFLLLCSIGFFFATQVQPKTVSSEKSRINAKEYDGFQALEAALIPIGSYLQLNDIPHAPTSIVRPINDKDDTGDVANGGLSGLVNSIIAAETSQSMSPKQRMVRQEAAKRWLAGIIPLRASRLPMGIFIPEQEHGGLVSPLNTIRAKITAGVKKVFRKLQKLVTRRESFNYVRTFNGLSPLEAVFIPRGYFIPLTAVSSYMGGLTETNTTNSSSVAAAKSIAGIQPLDSVLLPGGVFIPLSMSALPTLPSQLFPSAVTSKLFSSDT
jgi:hypothetical protein